ncbi:DUF6226 family protein [Cryobacterium sinapicolor]|uniref:DUF6226 family protein n=2 Tax=Cryobacterium TaxID=69578 RepID=UPI001F543B4F|nr:DUF6226 family protein [Cryobacterium sinapicolor]
MEIYRDGQGHPLDYGNRWGGASPPGDTYSRVSNPQRFEPVHKVADALIEWLQTTFDVAMDQTPNVADVVDGLLTLRRGDRRAQPRSTGHGQLRTGSSLMQRADLLRVGTHRITATLTGAHVSDTTGVSGAFIDVGATYDTVRSGSTAR